MAGDWIKWEHGLHQKPEVIRLAAMLSLPRDTIVVRLMVFWEWCDRNIPDESIGEDDAAVVSNLSSRDDDNRLTVDDIVGVHGFASALEAVGWATFDDGVLTLHRFGRHNGKTSKTRARNYKDQQRKRRGGSGSGTQNETSNDGEIDTAVIELSSRRDDKTLTRDRDRDREKKDPPSPASAGEAPPPTAATARGKTRPPERLTDADRVKLDEWTAERFPSLVAELDRIVEACLDWHRAKGRLAVDWLATCRNWIGKEAVMRAERHAKCSPGATLGRKPQTQADIEAKLAAARRLGQ